MHDELMQTEELMRGERGRLSILIAYSRDGVVLLDNGLRLLMINDAALRRLGLSGTPDDWGGRSLLDVVRDLRIRDPQVVTQILQELHRMRSGDEQPSEGLYHTETQVVHWSNLPVPAEQGVLGRLLILRAEPAAQGLKDRPESAYLSVDDSDALRTAVTAFVELSALESGRMPLNPSAFSFPELADRVLEAEQPLAQQRRLSLEHHIAHSLPLTWGDRRLIQRVLEHLVAFALRTAPPGGKVEIKATMAARDSEKISVSVSDACQAMPRPAADLEGPMKGDQGVIDVGLELAFCRLALKAHGEHLWISRIPAEGTTIAFTLPQLSASLSALHSIA